MRETLQNTKLTCHLTPSHLSACPKPIFYVGIFYVRVQRFEVRGDCWFSSYMDKIVFIIV